MNINKAIYQGNQVVERGVIMHVTADEVIAALNHPARFWCANGYNVAIVAVVGFAGDWTAYIGSTPSEGWREHQTVAFVKLYGCKLSKTEAEAMFRHYETLLELDYRE